MEKHFSEGKKVALRALSNEDISAWAEWFNRPETTEHMNKGAFPNTVENQEKYFLAMSASRTDLQLGVVSRKDDRLIGVAGIHVIDWIHRKAEISIVIAEKEYWGQGLATEAVSLLVKHAFTKLNLHRLGAGMWASNNGSKKCFEKSGFVLEGTLRQTFFCKGEYVDEYRLGLLRSDWEQSGS